MKKTALFILLIISLSVTSAFASDYTGTDPATPGYSAQDVQNQNLSAGDGIYWIDPDLPGGDASFQVYADLTTANGGWTMGNDASSTLPTLNGHTNAIAILAQNQQAEIRFVDPNGTYDAYYTGTWASRIPVVSRKKPLF